MHGPKPRSHAFKLNKKVRRLGLKIALTARAAEGKASAPSLAFSHCRGRILVCLYQYKICFEVKYCKQIQIRPSVNFDRDFID